MNKFFVVIFTLITGITFVYGENSAAVDGECKVVNILLEHVLSNNCCLTSGITCKNGHITEIYLSFLDYTGSIPPEIGNLPQLKSLYIKDSQIKGPIPTEIGNLSNLEKLNLENNNLNGSIPPEIGNLSNLTNLDISSNKLSGSIPSEIANLSNLEYLDLGKNELSGSIPPEFGDLPNLKELTLSFNKLCGAIPSFPDSLNLYIGFNSDLSKPCPNDVKETSANGNKSNSNVKSTSGSNKDNSSVKSTSGSDDKDNSNVKNSSADNSDKDDSNTENSQNNKGNLSKIILIIVAIAIISIIGFVAYTMLFKKSDNKKNTENNTKKDSIVINISNNNNNNSNILPSTPPEKDISSVNPSSLNTTNNICIQTNQKNQNQSSNASEYPFALINEVKKNDFISAQNIVNRYKKKIINNIDENGWTALHWACYYGYEKMVKLIINNEAELSTKTLKGISDYPEYADKTAKEIAELRDHKGCAKLISRCQLKRGTKSFLEATKSVAQVLPK